MLYDQLIGKSVGEKSIKRIRTKNKRKRFMNKQSDDVTVTFVIIIDKEILGVTSSVT